ncbi:tannase/feruloyl esterase family alpha/beta hydrolase [Sphingobium sufflavum]|uniref:tannase/feruloyl esterase family alpha/beta hydrolase n=1 Tax=Sphingobium sufflavum TaxID=1129547 RepID=UPI001F2D2574|nr:tannase/feruloyl esterase family alpha/beta hydrolase [Sphingobium sufflavum]MCE7797145.1 tannase/feruloyl esterase family alpha/beta hydrolase [Sphingobium sufflavum]
MRRFLAAGRISLAMAACAAGHGTGWAADDGAKPPPSQSLSAPTAQDCDRLGSLKLPDVEISVATSLPDRARVPAAGLTSMYGKAAVVATNVPAFCRVVGHIRPTKDSDIGFELWMPLQGWDGRLHGIGIGGFAGGIDYFTLSGAIRTGQAALATDTGHSGTMSESGWAKGHPEKVRDYGWRAVHLSTVAAKAIIAAIYGRGPDKSYFVGCSGGGRQGLMEAARFPDDYDGILSGAPAAIWTDLAIAMTSAMQAQDAPGAAIRRDQTRLLQEEVLRQCDGNDGQRDGLIADPRLCRFDASRLACSTSSSAQCFSPPQIAALNRIHAGARDSKGRQLAGGYLPSGSELGTPAPVFGWDSYLLRGPNGRSEGEGLASGLMDNFIQTPFPSLTTFDFDKDPARLKAALAADLDAPADLRRFFARGGKLILWHGWADAAIPPEATLRYHAAVARQSGKRAQDSTRLFMVPGVQHCAGGLGPSAFGQAGAPKPEETPDRNMVAALQAWVEGKAAAPESLVATRSQAILMGGAAAQPQRLLCALPRRAVLQPGGDPDKAASYRCQ